MNGKDKCEMLRNIRKNVAEQYGLRYEPRECHHKGDCRGTCPVCDAEVEDLQRQLDEKGITNVDVSDNSIQQEFGIFEEIRRRREEEERYSRTNVLQGDVMPPQFLEPLAGMPMPPKHVGYDYERVFIETYIAGIKFHDALEVWQDLYEGMPLTLVRDKENRYDGNAVAVEASLEKDGRREQYMLGYLPQKENEAIAALIDMGWEDLLAAEITDINEHKGKQLDIHISISIRNKRGVEIVTQGNRLRYMTMRPEEYAQTMDSIRKKGTVYFRWRFFPPWTHGMPNEGERILVINKNKEEATLHLMMVVAKDQGCIPFVEGGIDNVDLDDDRIAYVLVSLGREATLAINDASEIIGGLDESWQPDQYLSIERTERTYRILKKE